jgi:hypothetical protein
VVQVPDASPGGELVSAAFESAGGAVVSDVTLASLGPGGSFELSQLAAANETTKALIPRIAGEMCMGASGVRLRQADATPSISLGK